MVCKNGQKLISAWYIKTLSNRKVRRKEKNYDHPVDVVHMTMAAQNFNMACYHGMRQRYMH